MVIIFILFFIFKSKKQYLILNLLILNCINNDTIYGAQLEYAKPPIPLMIRSTL